MSYLHCWDRSSSKANRYLVAVVCVKLAAHFAETHKLFRVPSSFLIVLKFLIGSTYSSVKQLVLFVKAEKMDLDKLRRQFHIRVTIIINNLSTAKLLPSGCRASSV